MAIHIRVALVATAFVVTAALAGTTQPMTDVTVHEWGTFTSVAGEDGRAVPWRALDGSTDLPCFVERASHVPPKATFTTTVRMETPVIYFYSLREASVDVKVGFKQGFITEYFPRATLGPARVTVDSLNRPGFATTIRWRDVRMLPDTRPVFETESESNHYYAARATDAAPLQVGTGKERFLFYRGIGNFALPIAATVGQGEEVVIRPIGDHEIPAVMLFENRGGRIGFQIIDRLTREVTLSPPELEGSFDLTRAALEDVLVEQGLYPKEASAMLETWRDSWFTEGTRLFYVVPPRMVNEVLPLRIDPAPAHVARVFIGRLELATEATLTDVLEAARSNDRITLEKYGRFLPPFAERLLARSLSFEDHGRVQASLDPVPRVSTDGASACQ